MLRLGVVCRGRGGIVIELLAVVDLDTLASARGHDDRTVTAWVDAQIRLQVVDEAR